jgi:hypothetical protein
MMKHVFSRWMTGGLAILALTAVAGAAPITGSLPLSAAGTAASVLSGTNLSDSSTITMPGTVYVVALDGAVGGYTALDGDSSPVLDFGPHVLDLNNLMGFTLNPGLAFNDYGSFGGVTFGEIVSQSDNFLDAYLEGVFTPGPLIAAEAGPTSIRFSINKSGDSVSEAITLTAPPAPPAQGEVPEPGAWVLLCGGIGAIVLGRRGLRKA